MFEYDPEFGDYDLVIVDPLNPNKGLMDLTHMFSIGLPDNLQCGEAASVLKLAINGLGIESKVVTLWTGQSNQNTDPPEVMPFQTNLLSGIGHTTYSSFVFGYHAIVERTEASGEELWDGAAKYMFDPYGNDHQAPAFGWSMPEYWHNPPSYGLVDYGPGGPPQPVPVVIGNAVVGIYSWGDQTPFPTGYF